MTDEKRSQPNSAVEHTQTPWMWAWRDDETAPASIFSMVRVGHAYAVAMCPRYQKPEQWVADAKFILKAVNNHDALVKALEDLVFTISTTAIKYETQLPYVERDIQQARAAIAAVRTNHD